MNRREFLRSQVSACTGFALSGAAPLVPRALPPAGWRTFQVVTKVELLNPQGASHIWLPAAIMRDTPYQRTLANRFNAPGGTATPTKDKQNALGIVSATFPAGVKPALTLTSRVSLKNYAVDLSAPATPPRVSQADLNYFLQPSRYVPTDGIVNAIPRV